jgi:hypothetical protein
MRQRGAVDALGAQDIDVVLLDILVWSEGFRRAEHHVAGVVHNDVQPASIGDDGGDAGLGGGLGLHVELDRP